MDVERGRYLVSLARRSVEHFFKNHTLLREEPPFDDLKKPSGAFVTIKKFGELRGCIGYPLPVKPLYEAVIETAVLAAFDDPRFPPLTEGELPHVTFEVSVLSPPRRASPEEVVVGKHGLMVEGYGRSGLLLPQVAVEEGWDRETFLSHTCLKAGLPPDCWKDKNIVIKVFTAEVFGEAAPLGPVLRL